MADIVAGTAIKEIIEKIPFVEVAKQCKEFANHVENRIDSAVNQLVNFDKDLSRKISGISEAKELIEDAVMAAVTFIDTVDDFYYYGGEDTDFEKIKKDLVEGNGKYLEAYIGKMDKWISNFDKAYEDLTEKCDVAAKKCTECAESCSGKKAESKGKKYVTRAVGGAASAAALGGGIAAGGVAASIVAGIFTAGVGTVIGLGVTAVGLGVTGVGAATATGILAHDFAKKEDSFRSMSLCFRDLATYGIEIKHRFDDLLRILQKYKRNHIFLGATYYETSETNETKNHDPRVDTLCATLDKLRLTLEMERIKTSDALDTLNNVKEKVKNRCS